MSKVASPGEAETALADGAGDLIGLTRALIADADWPAKAQAGRVADIRPSSFDNFAWGEIHVGKPLAEILAGRTQTPDAGRIFVNEVAKYAGQSRQKE